LQMPVDMKNEINKKHKNSDDKNVLTGSG